MKPLDRKGLLVWGNWPDPGGGVGRVSPSLPPLLSPLLSVELSLVSISRKFWPQKMSWEKCPLFSGKKRLCKIVVNSSLFSRILKGNTLALKSSY